MGKGDRKTRKGKLFKGSYGKSRLRDPRKKNLISLNRLRKWSIERTYAEIGRYDFTVTVSFKKDSEAYNKYGRMISGQLYYTKKERQTLTAKINSGIKAESNGRILFTAVLKNKLTKDQIKDLATKGFKNTDIIDLTYIPYKHNPTFFNKRNKKLEDPIVLKAPGGISYKQSYAMMYGLFKKRIDDGDDLIEFEKLEMMAIKTALKIPDSGDQYKFTQIMKDRKAEFEFAVEEVLFWIEEIESYSDASIKNKSEVIKKIVDYEFNKAGINPDKPLEIINHLGLYSGLLQIGMYYQDEIILYETNPKVVLDFKGFMHVAFRHCNVCNIGTNNVAKSRIPYKLQDLKGLIKSCLHLMKDEINDHFKTHPEKRFSKFGERLIRFNGDYYEIHINTKGIIETFYNHEK